MLGLLHQNFQVTRTHRICEGDARDSLSPEPLDASQELRTKASSDVYSLSLIFFNLDTVHFRTTLVIWQSNCFSAWQETLEA